MDSNLKNLLDKHQIEITPVWNTEKPIRLGSQWFVGKEWEHDGKTFQKCWFGDYKKDLKETWASGDETSWSKEETNAAKKYVEEITRQEKEEREQFQRDIAPELESEFERFAREGSSSYLRRKQINGLFGARIKDNGDYEKIIAVPMYDTDGKFWNYQRIYAQKLSAGDKFFAEGARIDGTFFILEPVRQSITDRHGDGGATEAADQGRLSESERERSQARRLSRLTSLPTDKPIYIAEGYATAASIQMALGESHVVIASFNANNLLHVAKEIRLKFPAHKIVICADDDAHKFFPSGEPNNQGMRKGRAAAGSVSGELVYPIFKSPAPGLTDFNDLHCAQGLDTVRSQIEEPKRWRRGLIEPMCLREGKNKKSIVPSEKEVSDYLMKEIGDRLVKQDKAIFKYTGTHWEELSENGIDTLKQIVGIATNHLLGIRDIENYYRYFRAHMNAVPAHINMFQPNPYKANFLNGTLHLHRAPNGTFSLEFKPHDKHDYLLSVLPFDFTEEKTATPKFDQMLANLWSKNPDSPDILRLAQELLGACLMPAFPIIAFFHGPPEAGKSTFIKLLVKIVGEKNTSNVQPADFNGFNMETMVGKLVNFDTDTDINRAMSDSEVKKIIDRMPRRVRRKGRMDVTAYLPALHLFAANRPPKSLEGKTHAYQRRMALIHTYSFKPTGNESVDYENDMLSEELGGIVAFAIEGLKRLIDQKGKFSIPESSKDAVADMERQSDVVEQFLEDFHQGDLSDLNTLVKNSTKDGEQKISRTRLWEVFTQWQDSAVVSREHIGRNHFFSRLRSEGYKESRQNDGRYFSGFKTEVNPNGIC